MFVIGAVAEATTKIGPLAVHYCKSHCHPVHKLQITTTTKVQLPSRVSGHAGPSAIPSDEVRRIADMLHSQQDVLQRHRLLLLAPPQRSRQAFVLCGIRCISTPNPLFQDTTLRDPPREREREKRRVHTEKVLHQRPIRRAGVRVSERDDRRRQLAQAELLHRRGEGVCRVEGARVDLAREFAVGELLGGEDAGGPELFARGEGGGVEEVVVAVVGVHAAGGCQWVRF